MSNEAAARLNVFRNVPNNMLWKGATLQQVNRLQQLAETLGFQWDVVGHHTSKSIPLPVVRLSHEGMAFYLRDNFYDINLCVVAEERLTTPLSVLFEGILKPLDWEWYLREVARARNYSWKGWTDEQMDTPGLLALSDDAPWHSVKSPEEKTRWLRRMTDPAWYSKDWSSGKVVWDGVFGPGTKLWIQDHPFMQGIGEHVPESATHPYETGCKGFALALADLEQTEKFIKRLCGMEDSP